MSHDKLVTHMLKQIIDSLPCIHNLYVNLIIENEIRSLVVLGLVHVSNIMGQKLTGRLPILGSP